MRRYISILTLIVAAAGVARADEAAVHLARSTGPVLAPSFAENPLRGPLFRVTTPAPALSCQPPRVHRRNLDYQRMTLADAVCMLAQLPDRRPGSENGRRVEQFLANSFRALGCEVTRQEVPVNDWHCDEAALMVDGESLRCSAVPYSSLPGELTGRLVYVAEEEDLRQLNVAGAIVISEQRFPLQPTEALWEDRLPGSTASAVGRPEPMWSLHTPGITPLDAQAAGAAALIQILVDQAVDSPARFWPYQGPYTGVPSMYVCRQEGERLKAAAAEGRSASLSLKGGLERRFGQNIIAQLEGQSSRVYLFETHYDSPYSGAVDDATGVAAVLEIARHYAAIPQHQRPGRMVFACTTGHFDGAVGARMLVQDILPQWRSRYRAVFSLEQLGALDARAEGADLVVTGEPARQDVFVPDHDRLRASVQAAFQAARKPNVLLLPMNSDVYPLPPGEGGTLCAAGIPTIQFTSTPPYLLTDEDSLDKVDLRRVAQDVELVIDIVRRMG